MADRDYIIEVLLKARDETARAFATATGQLEAYDKLLEEQKLKTEAARAAQKDYAAEFARGDSAMQQRKAALEDLNLKNIKTARALDQVEQAQRRVTRAQLEGQGGTAKYAILVDDLTRKEKALARVLEKREGMDRELGVAEARAASQRIATEERLMATAQQKARTDLETARASEQAQRRIQNAIQQTDLRARQAAAAEKQRLADINRAVREVEQAKSQYAQNQGTGRVTPETKRLAATATDIPTKATEDVTSFGDEIARTGSKLEQFQQNAASTGSILLAFIQPALVLVGGLVGAFTSLASAAGAAGAAIGVTFVSALAQGLPVIGLFGAAMQRFSQSLSYATQLYGLQQQKFIAGYIAAYQNALGINQVTIAEHQLSDALFQAQLASRNLTVAQVGLLNARIQAQRQLQQLIYTEVNARLAAEASTLAVVDAQKALFAAEVTGGDVAAAQLQLREAKAQHTQARTQYQQATQDAARGSVARREIQIQLQQAQLAVTEARRAIVDSQFAVAQARASVIQAQQQAAGYNVQVAAQLAWLRSQMTTTERQLSSNILKILKLFQGVHGALRPVTDAILRPFITLSQDIYKLFTNRRVLTAFMRLAHSIAEALTRITHAIFSNQSISKFITIVQDAAKNIGPVATIAINLFKAIQQIVIDVQPYLHQFLVFLGRLAREFSTWVQSAQGKNWLKSFFEEAFNALKAFIRLGVAFGKFFAAVIGAGGGAKTGVSLLKDLTDWFNRTTDAINHHRGAWVTLQQLWGSAEPVLSALATAFGAIFKGFAQIASSSTGQQTLKDLANLVANVLVPAIIQFARVFSPFLHFFVSLASGPLGGVLRTFLAITLTLRAGLGVLQLFLKPLIGMVAIAKNLHFLFTDMFNKAGKLVRLVTGGKFGWGGGGAEPMVQAANTNLEASRGMQTAADTNLEASRNMQGAADVEQAAAGEQTTAASEQQVAGGEQITAGEEQQVAAGEQIAAGAGSSGGGFLSGLLARLGIAGEATSVLGPAGLAVGAGIIGNQFLPQSFKNWLAGASNDPAMQPPGPGQKLSSAQSIYGPSPSIVPASGGIASTAAGRQYLQAAKRTYPNDYGAADFASTPTGTAPWQLGGSKAMGILGDKFSASSLNNYAAQWANNVNKAQVALTASNQQIASIRERAAELSKYPWIKPDVKARLEELRNSLSKFNVDVARAGATWNRTFAGFDTTVKNVAQKVADQLNNNQQTINSNFRRGSSGWITQMTGDISAGIRKWQTLAHEGVKGTGRILDKLESQLKTLTKAMGISVPASIIAEITKGGAAGVQHFIEWLHTALQSQSVKSVQNLIKIFHGVPAFTGQTGGPVGGGYGGGDIVPALLEPGEHVFTKEEVKGAGGHGAVYAIRRALGGGRQGGPSRYAAGGQVPSASPDSGTPQQTSLASTGGTTIQGVSGYLGTALANLLQFRKEFAIDWANMWKQINASTKSNVTTEQNLFTQLTTNMQNAWKTINQNTYDSLKIFQQDFKNALGTVTGDVNKAFQYIVGATNAGLKAFQAKPVNVALGAIPKFAGGGFIGQMGERGKDAVLAMLGRGEAVLNYAHQKVVEPAMRSFYGFGLGEMFSKVNAQHGTEAPGGMATGGMAGKSPGGSGGGGYVFPFGGSGWSWGRTDQGVDFGGNAPIGAIGNSRVTYSNPNDGWYSPAPAFMVYELLDGPDRGRFIYVAEHISNMAPTGFHAPAGQAIAQMTGGIEMGWAAGPQGHQIVEPMGANHLTSAGQAFHDFLVGLTHGQILGAPPGGAGVAMTWKAVKDLVAKGGGALGTLTNAAIKKLTDAANAFGRKQAGLVGGGVGSAAGVKALPGGWYQVGATIDPTQGQAPTYSDHGGFSFAELLVAGSNAYLRAQDLAATLGIANGQYGMPMETPIWVRMPGGSKMFKIWKNDVGSGQSGSSHFKVDLHQAIATALGWSPNQDIQVKKAFAEGGIVGPESGPSKPIPIVAHSGEWVLNKIQQSKVASWIGTSRDRVKQALGFTGGPKSFQGGGQIGDPTVPPVPSTVYTPYAKSGAFVMPPIPIETIAFYNHEFRIFEQETRQIITNIETTAKGITKGISQFITNINLLAGDNGLFAQMFQEIQNVISNMQTNLQLATEGIKIVHNTMRQGTIPVALKAAELSQRTLKQQGKDLQNFYHQTVETINQINRQLDVIRKGGITKAERDNYNKLLAARQNLLNLLHQDAQAIAQNYADQLDAAQTRYQTAIDQYMRSGGYLFPHTHHQRAADKRRAAFTASIYDIRAQEAVDSGESLRQFLESQFPHETAKHMRERLKKLRFDLSKIGPAIAAGIAQTQQTIAQALGDPTKLAAADQAVLAAAQETKQGLSEAYRQAAKKARKDPRWQKVADDLLGQLEQAQSAVVQAQAQALQDAITAVDTKAQLQQAAQDMRNRLITASMALGTTTATGGIRQQIGLSEQNLHNLFAQTMSYENLLGTARQQGNIQVINDLTQKIEGLTAQIAEAEVTTQQLITSLHETAITIVNTQAQASSGFFQSASNIIQTLGQITGSLNLPQLIQIAKETADQLRGPAGTTGITAGSLADKIVDAVRSAMKIGAGGEQAFGVFQSQADELLSPLMTAFKQGPEAFAMTLAQIGPNIAALESKMPQDVGQLFQSLIQSMIDNTTAVVQNNQQLQQLNATTNQQNFTSSAWRLFRQAIFSGLGTLLAPYAMTVPSMDVGGYLTSNGVLYGHRGEVMLPANVVKGGLPSTSQENHFHFEEPMEVADPVHLGNAIAFRLSHDPNSR